MKKPHPTLYWVSVILGALFLNAANAQILTGGSDSSSMTVTVKVNQSCSISTSSGLNFSVYDPVAVNATTALNATALVSVVCTKGSVGMTMGLSNGGHASNGTRAMIGTTSASYLAYTINQPPSNVAGTACTFPGTIPWTNVVGVGMLSIATAPDTVARTYSICGTVAGGQVVPADTFTDTITATINF